MLGYLGPEGTFSHQAAKNWSKGMEELKEYSSMRLLIQAVDNEELDKAIVPIENSIEGSVNAAIDTIVHETDLYITGEYILRICENILVKKGTKKEDIKLITSHPQPIGQCSKILKDEFPEVKTEAAESTSSAAKRVSESDGSIACIGSKACADIYDLEILRENCADDKHNSTRFVVIEKQPNKTVTDNDKTSIAFATENKPGALYNVLKMFAESNINLLKIESRPAKDELGRYIFIVDTEGNIDDAKLYFCLDKIKNSTEKYKFLGSYAIAF